MKSLNSQTVIDLNTIRQVYFLGIGGIGMSALARYFNATGLQVAGYDRTATELTFQLESEGIEIHFEDDPSLIPPPFLSPADTLVVITPAVPQDHAELALFKSGGFPVYKRSEILGLITRSSSTIAVAGTHGKTTVSTMIAHLMTHAGPGCNAFLGGISRNFNSNLVLHPGSEWVVAEADEFDRSFLRLFPKAAVVTSMDPDHLDIYGEVAEMEDAFNLFIGQINKKGVLLMKQGLPVRPAMMPATVYTYDLHGKADFHPVNIRLIHPGLVNVENAAAACAMAFLLGLDPDKIRQAMENFTGIQRRFEYHIKTDRMVFIDDYAHHPKEIEATLVSLRALYPDKKLTGVFQPHLFTRTRDFASEFAESLGLLDELILLDIYPAREMPIEGVSADLIFSKVKINNKTLCSKEQLTGELKKRHVEVLITLGAGDIDKQVEPIAQMYRKEEV